MLDNDFARACLAHRPMTVVVDLGTRLHYAHAYKIRKWRLRNGHQSGSVVKSVVNSIIDLKTPSGRRAPHLDKCQFSSEIAVSSPTVFQDITVEHCGRITRKQGRRKMELSLRHTFSFRCFPGGLWATTRVSLMMTKVLKEEARAFK